MNLESLWTTFSIVVFVFLAILFLRAISVWHQRQATQALLDAAILTSSIAYGTADWNRNAFPGFRPGPLFLGAANGSAMYYDGDQHLITIAPTRTGKGTCHIIPNLLTYQGSMVVNDIKGENYKHTGHVRLEFGQVFRFAPFDEETDSFNPLDFVRRGTSAAFDDAMLVADMLVVPGKDDEGNHWKESAKSLLAGLIVYVTESESAGRRNMQRVRHLLTLSQADFLKFIQEKMAVSQSPFVARSANMLLQKSDRERSGVISTAQAQTSIWDSEPLARATQISTFRLEDLRDQLSTLYIIVPPERLSTYKSVLRVMLGLALSTMTRQLPERSERPPLTFMFDEFPSLGYMQPIVDAMAYLAGYGCRLWLFAQDLGQIREIYRDKATSLLANCGARSFFGVADYETAEYVSKMAGQKTVLTSTRSLKTNRVLFWDDVWQVEAQNLQYTGVPLITPDEVMRLPARGEEQRQLVFLQGHAPVYALKIPFTVVEAWQAAVVSAPVSVQLDKPPMPPGSTPEQPPQPKGLAAAAARPKEPRATVAEMTRLQATAATDNVPPDAAHPSEKIPLVTEPGPAYIEEGNNGKGQGMTTDELIKSTEESSDAMHERMVGVARNLREWERKLRELENEATKFTEGTNERENADYLVGRAKKNVDDLRFLLGSYRKSIDGKNSLLDKLNGDE